MLAQRAFAPDEVIISLPRQLTIPFEGTPEEACILLLYIYHTRREQFGPWLDMLPGPEDFIAWDCLRDTDLAHLQCSQMVNTSYLSSLHCRWLSGKCSPQMGRAAILDMPVAGYQLLLSPGHARRIMPMMCCLQEGALAQRRTFLEAVWQEGNGPTQMDALYSRQKLLGSLDLDWNDVQWAANIVRSRSVGSIIPILLLHHLVPVPQADSVRSS